MDVKIRKKKKLRKRRKDSGSDSSSSGSEMDLEHKLKPIGEYMKDRREMLNQMFRCLKGPQLQSIIPKILKKIPFNQLKEICADELEVMSKKRIQYALEGREMTSSSGTDETSDTEPEETMELLSTVRRVMGRKKGGVEQVVPDSTTLEVPSIQPASDSEPDSEDARPADPSSRNKNPAVERENNADQINEAVPSRRSSRSDLEELESGEESVQAKQGVVEVVESKKEVEDNQSNDEMMPEEIGSLQASQNLEAIHSPQLAAIRVDPGLDVDEDYGGHNPDGRDSNVPVARNRKHRRRERLDEDESEESLSSDSELEMENRYRRGEEAVEARISAQSSPTLSDDPGENDEPANVWPPPDYVDVQDENIENLDSQLASKSTAGQENPDQLNAIEMEGVVEESDQVNEMDVSQSVAEDTIDMVSSGSETEVEPMVHGCEANPNSAEVTVEEEGELEADEQKTDDPVENTRNNENIGGNSGLAIQIPLPPNPPDLSEAQPLEQNDNDDVPDGGSDIESLKSGYSSPLEADLGSDDEYYSLTTTAKAVGTKREKHEKATELRNKLYAAAEEGEEPDQRKVAEYSMPSSSNVLNCPPGVASQGKQAKTQVENYDSDASEGEIPDEGDDLDREEGELLPPGFEEVKPVSRPVNPRDLEVEQQRKLAAEAAKTKTSIVPLRSLYNHLKAAKEAERNRKVRSYGAETRKEEEEDIEKAKKLDRTRKREEAGRRPEGPSVPPPPDYEAEMEAARAAALKEKGDLDPSTSTSMIKEKRTKKRARMELTPDFLANLEKKKLSHEEEMKKKKQLLEKLITHKEELLKRERDTEERLRKLREFQGVDISSDEDDVDLAATKNKRKRRQESSDSSSSGSSGSSSSGSDSSTGSESSGDGGKGYRKRDRFEIERYKGGKAEDYSRGYGQEHGSRSVDRRTGVYDAYRPVVRSVARDRRGEGFGARSQRPPESSKSRGMREAFSIRGESNSRREYGNRYDNSDRYAHDNRYAHDDRFESSGEPSHWGAEPHGHSSSRSRADQYRYPARPRPPPAVPAREKPKYGAYTERQHGRDWSAWDDDRYQDDTEQNDYEFCGNLAKMDQELPPISSEDWSVQEKMRKHKRKKEKKKKKVKEGKGATVADQVSSPTDEAGPSRRVMSHPSDHSDRNPDRTVAPPGKSDKGNNLEIFELEMRAKAIKALMSKRKD